MLPDFDDEGLLPLGVHSGCPGVYLDGSFVTSKEIPNDYDVCWDTAGVDQGKLDPVLVDEKFPRMKQKLKFGGEFFANNPWGGWVIFFQQVKEPISRDRKGIVRIGLRDFP